MRISACDVLAAIGPKAKAAVPALLALLRPPDASRRGPAPTLIAACDALMAIRPAADEAVPSLIAALRHERPEVCVRAANVLGSLGPAAKGAVPELVAALKRRPYQLEPIIEWGEPEPDLGSLHEWLIVALGKIGPAAKGAVPALQPFRKDPVERVRKATESALAAIEGK